MEKLVIERRMRVVFRAFKSDGSQPTVRRIDAERLIPPHAQFADAYHAQCEREQEDKEENSGKPSRF